MAAVPWPALVSTTIITTLNIHHPPATNGHPSAGLLLLASNQDLYGPHSPV